jgi:serine phosphatase RsbU (regulator of sigma subunit)
MNEVSLPQKTVPLSILVVDDERVNKQLAIAIIEDCGHNVTETSDGAQAVQLVMANDFHLVLMDVDMPRMDGLQATRLIREYEKDHGKHTPIVALTASIDRETCLAAGMDEYLVKPINAIQLSKTIERLGVAQVDARPGEADILRILMVEDSLTSARLAELCLQHGMLVPYSLEIVKSLKHATARLAVAQFDLLLLDLNLPDSEGLDTFLTVHEISSDTPIVILSGESDETQAITAVRRGAQDYLVKGRFDEAALCRAVYFAIERSRRRAEQQLQSTRRQLYVAQAVQRELFPKSTPDVPGLDMFGKCEPADETGGDYYDYIPIGDDWAIVVGDASGHGVGAAFLMVAARAILRSLSKLYGDTGYLLSTMNELLTEDMRKDTFITLLLTKYDPQARWLTYSSAGHVGYLLNASGKVKHQLEPSGPPLNVVDDFAFHTSKPVRIESGDILLQFTDGAADRRSPSGELFGDERLVRHVNSHRDLDARGLVEMLFRDVHEFGGGTTHEDDITIVVAKFD